MKVFSYFLLLFVVFSCAEKPKPEDKIVKLVKVIAEKPAEDIPENDSILYINRVGYFPETNEFYVPLNFKNEVDYEVFKNIAAKTDSTLPGDGFTERERLPMPLAQETLNLDQLSEIKIYSSQNQFITNATLKRVEYVQELTSYFVAVFTPENKRVKEDKFYYCLGMAPVDLKNISIQEINDSTLTKRIINELNIKSNYVWEVKHIKTKPNNTVYSIYASDEVGKGTVSYLTEYKEGKLTLLHAYKDEVAFYGLFLLPIQKNGKPVLLIHLILPESDAVDEYVVATYTETGYKLEVNNRIRIK